MKPSRSQRSPRRRLLFPWAALLAGLVACGGDAFVDSGSGSGGGSSSSGTTGGSGGNGAGQGGSAPSYTSCDLPEQCLVTANTCCGVCGAAELPDVTAVNGAQLQSYQEAICGDPAPPCPDCPSAPNPNLFAYCEMSQCLAADIRLDALSACTGNDECVLRDGLGCCQGCSGDAFNLVAVNSTAEPALQGRLCGPGTIGCPECEPQFPPGASTECVEGHCVVVLSSP